ncbi:MAG: hypothetical protein ACPHK0_08010, partial [Dehalococcoidia bacterium]
MVSECETTVLMFTRLNWRLVALLAVMLFAVVLVACSSGGDDSDEAYFYTEDSATGSAGFPGEDGKAGYPGAPGAPAATPRPDTIVDGQFGDSDDAEFESPAAEPADPSSSGSKAGGNELEQEIASATEGRVIIRTGDLSLVVESV